MHVDVLKSIYQHPDFTTEHHATLFAAHERLSFKKGEFLLKKGAVANEYYIIESGLVRHFVYDYDGNEITTEFVTEGEVVIEVASIFHRLPTQEHIQCLTDCTLWRIGYNDFQKLFTHIPALAEWGRAWMSYELHRSKVRTIDMITTSASQRYINLVKHRVAIVQHAPLKHIASYLGITDTSLSRIRKEISSKLL